MATIIDGNFSQRAEAERAMAALARAGFAREHTATFFVNPAGQHDLYPVGGDEDESPGAADAAAGSATGAMNGGAVGLAAGLAAMPVLGPAAIIAASGAGAYSGSLTGAMSQTDDANHERSPDGGAVRAKASMRKSGMLVAVALPDDEEQDTAIDILRHCGADDIERTEGEIRDGDWTDFDALAPVRRMNAG